MGNKGDSAGVFPEREIAERLDPKGESESMDPKSLEGQPELPDSAAAASPDFFDGVSGKETLLNRFPVFFERNPVEWKARGEGRASGVMRETPSWPKEEVSDCERFRDPRNRSKLGIGFAGFRKGFGCWKPN